MKAKILMGGSTVASRIFYRRWILPITDHQGQQLAGFPITRHKFSRFVQATKQPAEEKSVRPRGDVRLVAREKTDGRADAVNAGLEITRALQHQPQSFLRAAAETDHDMFRPALIGQVDEGFIPDAAAGIIRGEVAIVFIEVMPLRTQPREVLITCGGVGHDPQDRFAGLKRLDLKQMLEVSQAGNPRYFFPGQQPPDQDHQPAVGYGEIRVKQGLAIIPVGLKFDQRRGRRHDDQAALQADLHGLFDTADEKVNSQNALKRRGPGR